ncbi:MAG TPA: coproporphyrinogen dehydrogenase HemZ [Clostridia bacterium]|nr:coproporphyrinogen dehydrogenase HemZ [Clostridia bacterium]
MMYRVRLEFPAENYLNDVQDVPRAFAPYLEIDETSPDFLSWDFCYEDGFFKIRIFSNCLGNFEDKFSIEMGDSLQYKRLTKRFLKIRLYEFLSQKLGVELPYGSLTGVRPTKLYYELKEKSIEPEAYLAEEFRVTENRIKLIRDCVNSQDGIINTAPDAIALFINIPFCPTRCNYCSFISTELFRVKKEIPRYVENVIREIDEFKSFIAKSGKRITSIYVGGGTPTCIGAENLDRILNNISTFGVEFTVEAGRPDTITAEILDVLKKNNVTRISINPQSFNQSTLERIGRMHTTEQVYESFRTAREKSFVINMDLIAMLQDETLDDFRNSVDRAIELRPHNITVHTLSLKRGSVLTQEGEKKGEFGLAKAMTDYAHAELYKAGYKPYYMYRQKNTADNLENISFTLDGYQCRYNIDMMEEASSIYGIGAGAMSKIVDFVGNRIERLANPKGFREYMERLPEIAEKKRSFFGE